VTTYFPQDPDETIESIREKLKLLNQGIVSEAWERLVDSVASEPPDEEDDDVKA
jgi:hypothetical protein